MKPKFMYTFRDGHTLTDRNGYKTMAEAQSWANAHNKARGTTKSDQVIKITPIVERNKPKAKKKQTHGLAGQFKIKMPRF